MSSRIRYQPRQIRAAVGSFAPMAQALQGLAGDVRQRQEEARREANQNAFLEYGNQLSALDTSQFVDVNALDTELSSMQEATSLRFADLSEAEQQNYQLRMQRGAQGVRQQWQRQRDTLAMTDYTLDVGQQLAAFDYTLRDVEGVPLYDPMNPASVQDLHDDLMARAEASIPASVTGLQAERYRQQAASLVNSKANAYRKYQASEQQAQREARAGLALEHTQDAFLADEMGLPEVQEHLRTIITSQHKGLLSEDELEWKVGQESERLFGLKINRMIDDGQFPEVRHLLADPAMESLLSPEAYGSAVGALRSEGVKSAKAYVDEQYARAMRDDDPADDAAIYQSVLDATGSADAAREAVEYVGVGRLAHGNALKPLTEVEAGITAERGKLSGVSGEEYTRRQQQLDTLQKLRREQETALQADPVAYLHQMGGLWAQSLEPETLIGMQRGLSVKTPRALSKVQASELLGVLGNDDVAEADKLGVLARRLQGYVGLEALVEEDLITAGLPERMSPFLYGLVQNSIPAHQASRVMSALMTEAPKLPRDEQDALEVEVDNALEDYTAFTEQAENMTGDYGFRKQTLEPVRDAMVHLRTLGFEDADRLALMLMGNRTAVVEDNVALLTPEGRALTDGGLLALQRLAQEEMYRHSKAALRQGDYAGAVAYEQLPDAAVWVSEGDELVLTNPAAGWSEMRVLWSDLLPIMEQAQARWQDLKDRQGEILIGGMRVEEFLEQQKASRFGGGG